MTIIRWEKPPPRRHGTIQPERWAAIAAELRQRRGEWAVVAESDTPTAASIAQCIRDGVYAAFTPSGSFDAVSRTLNGNGKTYAVYARYIGEQRET